MGGVIEDSIFRVMNPEGQATGSGFLIAPQVGVTCAQVVEAAGGFPGGSVPVCFNGAGQTLEALVTTAGWLPAAQGNLCFVRFRSAPGVEPPPLGSAANSLFHKTTLVGFPAGGAARLRRVTGQVTGVLRLPGRPNDAAILQTDYAPGDQELAGAPLVDQQTGCIIGMITPIPGDLWGAFVWAICTEAFLVVDPGLHLQITVQKTGDLRGYLRHLLDSQAHINLGGLFSGFAPGEGDADAPGMEAFSLPLDKVYFDIQLVEAPREAAPDASPAPARPAKSLLSGLRRAGPAVTSAAAHSFSPRDAILQGEPLPDGAESLKISGALDALQKHRRLVIYGMAGAGKTTLLRYLLRRLAQRALEIPAAPAPVFISLREYAQARSHKITGGENLTLPEFALLQAKNMRLPQAAINGLAQKIEDQAVVWLLDALDETLNFASEVEKEISALPGSLVVTSRPFTPLNQGGLAQFLLPPLTFEQTGPFILNWLAEAARARPAENPAAAERWALERAQWLQRQLQASPRLKTLFRKPLYLTFLLYLALREQELDILPNRAELYRLMISELINTWETRRWPRDVNTGASTFRIDRLVGEEARSALLAVFDYTGWALQLFATRSLPEKQMGREADIHTMLAQLLEKHHPAWADLTKPLLAFWQEAGLLVRRAEGEEIYLAFAHYTFQEFAAASTLAEFWQENPKGTMLILRPRLHHPAWREPLLLLFCLLTSAQRSALLRDVLSSRSDYERGLYRDLRLGAQLLAERSDVEPRVKRKIIGQVAWLGRPHTLLRGLTALAGLAGGAALAKLLLAPWLYPFVSALWLLVWLYSQFAASVGVIGAVYFQRYPHWFFPSFPDRTLAVRLLQQIEGIPPQIARRFLQDRDRTVRQAALRAFAPEPEGEAQTSPAGGEQLRDLLDSLQSPDLTTRILAIQSLGQLGSPLAIPYLLALLKTDPAQDVPAVAAVALGEIGAVEAVPDILQIVLESDPEARKPLIAALGQIGDPRAVPVLIQVMFTDVYTVPGVAAALGNIRDRRAVQPLLIILSYIDDEFQAAAAEALGKIGDPQAVPALIHVLQEGKFRASAAAALALGNIGDPRALQPLLVALKRPEQMRREAAAEALGLLGNARALPFLLTAANDRLNSRLRRLALEAAGRLVPGLKMEERTLRRSAERTLRARLLDVPEVSPAAFFALDQLAGHLSTLRAAKLEPQSALFPPAAPKSRWAHARTFFYWVLVAVVTYVSDQIFKLLEKWQELKVPWYALLIVFLVAVISAALVTWLEKKEP